jgi:beta-N-acetylhexosaminidase
MMKKRIHFSNYFISLLILSIFSFTPHGGNSIHNNISGNNSRDDLYPSIFDLNNSDIEWIENKLEDMTVEQKCAQMIMPWAMGSYNVNDTAGLNRLIYLVKDLKVGGFLFKKGNIKDESAIIKKLQNMSGIPLLTASDFENGLGMKLSDAVEFPYNMALCAAGDPHLVYLMGKAIGEEGRALGMQMNFAPVVDINDNPWNPVINIRSFSNDKYLVSLYSRQFIWGLQDSRMLSTAKHFPGHGNTFLDSHVDMPKIALDKYNLLSNELIPFINSIQTGIPAIMVGHLDVPSLEDQNNLPASLSPIIIDDVLKTQLGFKGLVITDAMNMKAITNYFSNGQAAVKAVEAGNDIILMPPDEYTALKSLVNAVKDGTISIDRINGSVRKILAAKRWVMKNQMKINSADVNKIGRNKEAWRLAEEIANKSITLLKNDKSLIPIDPNRYYKTACITITNGPGNDYELLFQKLVDNNFGYVRKIEIDSKSTSMDYDNAVRIAEKANLILLPLFMGTTNNATAAKIEEKNIAVINRILELKKPCVVLNFGNPYLISSIVEPETYLCSYGAVDVSQYAMLDAILGRISINGTLPISIPTTEFKRGDGIQMETLKLVFNKTAEDSNYNFFHIDSILQTAISDSVFPGGVLLIGKEGKVIFDKAFGHFTYSKNSTPMMTGAIFNIASLSDVVGTTAAAMILSDEGKLNLDDKVEKYFPELNNTGKESITIKNLLLHNADFSALGLYYKYFSTSRYQWNEIAKEKLLHIDSVTIKNSYDNIDYYILAKVIEKITGGSLDKYLNEEIFKPLGMNRTMFNPPAKYWYYCPPSSNSIIDEKNSNAQTSNTVITGEADGNTGLFSSAEDLAVFCQMLLQHGKYSEIQLLKSKTIEDWTKKQYDLNSGSFGWNLKSGLKSQAGILLSNNSYGKADTNGTSIWIDPDRKLFVILLTNARYQKDKKSSIQSIRPALYDAIVKAVNYSF